MVREKEVLFDEARYHGYSQSVVLKTLQAEKRGWR